MKRIRLLSAGLLLFLATALVPGSSLLAGENGDKPQAPAKPAAPDPFNWGEAADGLKLGLVPTGRGDTPERRNVYFEGESLKFALYLRNVGERDLTLLHAAPVMPDFQVVIAAKDGGKSWVAKYPADELAKEQTQAPAPVRLGRGTHGNCPVELTPKWRFESLEGGGAALKALPVGKYTLQVTYQPQLAKGETGWQGKAVTAAADIEVRVKPAPTVGGGSGGGVPRGGGGAVPRPPIHGGGVM